MLIKSMSIENLRGIKKCDLLDLGQINLIIGKNNQGKSTILDALLLTSALLFYPNHQVFAIVSRHSERSYNPRELVYKYNQHPLGVTITLEGNETFTINTQEDSNNPNNFSFYFSTSYAKNEKIQITGFGPEGTSNFRELSSRNLHLQNKPNQRKKGVLRELQRTPGSGPREVQAPEEVLSFLENISIVDPAVALRLGQLESQFDETKQGERYDTTFEVVKQTYEDKCRSWELSRYLGGTNENRTAFTYGGGRHVYVDDLGDGMKTGFAAITLSGIKTNTVLLVEEIETHQHPAALRKLVKFLIETVRNNELQLFVTTHSPDVLRYFTEFYPKTKVLLVEKDANDIAIAQPQSTAIDIFSKIGWDFGDLFKYERIVLTDGTEDCIIIEDLYSKVKGRSLNSDGIDLLALRGTTKFPETVRAFAISNKQAILIRDLDIHRDKNVLVNQTKDWLRVLRDEGYTVEELADRVEVGRNGFGNHWVLPYSNILFAGSPERFQSYQTHSITDYMLEFVLDNRQLFKDMAVPGANFEPTGEKSKDALRNIFGKYNDEITQIIVDKIVMETIPASLKQSIINRL